MSQATTQARSSTGARMARARTPYPDAPTGTIPPPPGYREWPPQPPAREAKPPKRRTKITNGLVALSSAAILSVYAVGYTHTESADALAAGGIPIQGAAITQGAPATATRAPNGNGGYFLLTPSALATGPAAALAPTNAATATSVPTATNAAATTAASPTSRSAQANAGNTADATAPMLAPTATRAATPTTASRPTAMPTKAATTGQYQDGTYVGTGTSRRGDIEVTLTVQGGKITAAQISRCGTSYSCSRVAALPGEVVARQSAAVDHISGATYSTQAFTGAVTNAIAQAKGQ